MRPPLVVIVMIVESVWVCLHVLDVRASIAANTHEIGVRCWSIIVLWQTNKSVAEIANSFVTGTFTSII